LDGLAGFLTELLSSVTLGITRRVIGVSRLTAQYVNLMLVVHCFELYCCFK